METNTSRFWLKRKSRNLVRLLWHECNPVIIPAVTLCNLALCNTMIKTYQEIEKAAIVKRIFTGKEAHNG